MTSLDSRTGGSLQSLKPTGVGKKGVLALLNAIDGFQPALVILNGFSPTGIAIDPTSRRVILVKYGNLIERRCEDLLESQIVVDDVTVAKSNLSSRIIGAAVGEILAGGVGAVVGGMATTTTSNQIIRQVTVKILLNDLSYPSHSIDFIGTTWYGQTYPRIAIPEAQHLHDYLRVVIHQNETVASPGDGLRDQTSPV